MDATLAAARAEAAAAKAAASAAEEARKAAETAAKALQEAAPFLQKVSFDFNYSSVLPFFSCQVICCVSKCSIARLIGSSTS